MRCVIGILLLVVTMSSPVAAQKVLVDYDREYDFGDIKTFAWVDTETSLRESDPLTDSRIKQNLEQAANSAGLEKVDDDPDVYITYHASNDEAFNASSLGYGYGYGGWGVGMHGDQVEYAAGTLVVEIWDRKSKTMVLQGSAASALADNPEKSLKRIERMIAKLSRAWDPVLLGTGGGGDPCYKPKCKCKDGSCKEKCCKG